MDVTSVIILGVIGLTSGLILYRFGGKKSPKSGSSRFGGKNDRPVEPETYCFHARGYLKGRSPYQ